ncbi:uroporphyrinogen-III synthase [Sphingomonas solaris]|uniref:Uroporphyrinogen III synthase HEM4 n=1 Tax=Alterirhizorhabdus solaris TaxID=2529389 RepID=A0A558R4J6_9SPHN|nr:uroporphyrinogen-III synthase [Sphingomonas solaris]TVV74267.1 uroporphyrinogen III synthase HEM4 [Sphingomonas solaris]
MLLILRPRPGASETAARAAALGFVPVMTPLFTVRPLDWTPPARDAVAAVVMTSANAARHAGPALAGFRALPVWAVGAATARAARDAGCADVRAGDADAAALAGAIRDAGTGPVLHLAGADHRPLDLPGTMTRIVYRADPVAALDPPVIAALRAGAVALLHSPRAAALLRDLALAAGLRLGDLRIAAISPAAIAPAAAQRRATSISGNPAATMNRPERP